MSMKELNSINVFVGRSCDHRGRNFSIVSIDFCAVMPDLSYIKDIRYRGLIQGWILLYAMKLIKLKETAISRRLSEK